MDVDLGSENYHCKKSKNSNGYLSIFPIKDFDFDFYNDDYKKLADSIPYSDATGASGLYEWYKGGTGSTGDVPLFNYYDLSSNLLDNS